MKKLINNIKFKIIARTPEKNTGFAWKIHSPEDKLRNLTPYQEIDTKDIVLLIHSYFEQLELT